MPRRADTPARLCAALFAVLLGSASAPVTFEAAPDNPLRVCADPNNLPFSNEAGAGFENKLAEIAARDLKRPLTYVFAPQRDNFIRTTLGARRCDVVMGAPVGWDEVDVTRPYYASTYVFVSRADRKLALSSLKDPRLKSLRIGVHLLGEADTPPLRALGGLGIVSNVAGFMIYGDTGKPNPAARPVDAVANGEVDVALVWGPLGGYFAKQSRVPLAVATIGDAAAFAPLVFQYEIGIGVRKGDAALKAALDGVIARHRDEIGNLLAQYGVPVVRPG
jgi:mxaJ protein